VRSKHLLPLGIALSLALLTVAINTYPGGNQIDANSIGFDWKQNYLCNLFGKTAVNGARNSARIWAITGWFILCASFACFFIRFSKNIAVQGASPIAVSSVRPRLSWWSLPFTMPPLPSPWFF